MSAIRQITINCSIKLLEDGLYFADVKGYPVDGSGRTVHGAIGDAMENLQGFFGGVANGHVTVKMEVLSARGEIYAFVEDTRQLTLDLGEVEAEA